jgi:hypothetical protein
MATAGIVKNVLIVSSGRMNYARTGALDDLIRRVRAIGKTPVVILGPDGDDVLRTSTELENCEIVFDTNFQGEFFSSINAGLHVLSGATFVVPLEFEGNRDSELAFDQWEKFELALLEPETKAHVLRPVTQNNEKLAYPMIITGRGLLPLKALPAATDWTNSDRIEIADFKITP